MVLARYPKRRRNVSERASSLLLSCFLLLSLVAKNTLADELIGLCCLCDGCGMALPGRWDLEVEHGKTCTDLIMEMADDANDSKQGNEECLLLKENYHDRCCNSKHTPLPLEPGDNREPEEEESDGDAYPDGDYEPCHVCKDRSYPENEFTQVAVLDGEEQMKEVRTCKDLYWYGLKGHFEGRMCAPLQNFYKSPCGCKGEDTSGGEEDDDNDNGDEQDMPKPVPEPTAAPTIEPTPEPTTAEPTTPPTDEPTRYPTFEPTAKKRNPAQKEEAIITATKAPSPIPTKSPTELPTKSPQVQKDDPAADWLQTAPDSWELPGSVDVETDGFGSAMVFDGNFLVVGAPHQAAPDGTPDVGAVYVFERQNNNDQWIQVLHWQPSTFQKGDRVGMSVAMDGDVIAVGAPGDDETEFDAGAVYILARSAATNSWRWNTKLTLGVVRRAAFGTALALRDDCLVVSAPYQDSVQGRSTGLVFVFYSDSDGVWTYREQLLPRDVDRRDSFGADLDLSGNTLIVGAPGHDLKGARDAGAAYVYMRGTADEIWTLKDKLVATDREKSDRFGYAVAVDGKRLAVGAPWVDTKKSNDAGAVYLFELSSSSDIRQVSKLMPLDSGEDEFFGQSVALSTDTVAVGSHDRYHPAYGAAHVFRFDDDVATWLEVLQVESRRVSAFGRSVATHCDTVVAGGGDVFMATKSDVSAQQRWACATGQSR